MKKLTLFATLAMAALLFVSCNKTGYKSFVGTWGVEKIEYYNIDYAGNPIAGSLNTYFYDPSSTDNGIQMIFRENKTGEIRDSAIDTIWIKEDETVTYICCPDTVLVYTFTYSYDESSDILYMNTDYGTYINISGMHVYNRTDNSFIYENEYQKDYVEKAYVKRISKTTKGSGNRQTVRHPHKPGSFLGGR